MNYSGFLLLGIGILLILFFIWVRRETKRLGVENKK